MSIIKRLQEATGKTSLSEIVRKAGLSIAFDGNWGESAIWSAGKETRLVGKDTMGNTYYEDLTRPYGRHRWVVYSDMDTYAASQVTPQWHAWLHCISDDDPSQSTRQKLKFELQHAEHPTGSKNPYLPKGSWQNPNQMNWRKVQFWDPNAK